MKEFYLITFSHKWLDCTAIGAGFANKFFRPKLASLKSTQAI